MKQYFKLFGSGCAIAALAACGGGGDSGGSGGGSSSFDELASQGTALFTEFDGVAPSVSADMPGSELGVATYIGIAAFNIDRDFDAQTFDPATDDVDALSRATIEVDFSTTDVEGRFDNFRDADDFAIVGALEFSGSRPSQNGTGANSFAATGGTGAFTEDADTVTFTFNVGAQFLGLNAEGVQGEVTGTYVATGPSFDPNDNEGTIEGGFIASR